MHNFQKLVYRGLDEKKLTYARAYAVLNPLRNPATNETSPGVRMKVKREEPEDEGGPRRNV